MDEHQIYDTFVAQLCEWAKTGKTPDTGNQDIRHGLALQQERLDKHNAKIEYNLKLRGEEVDTLFDAVFSSAKYTNKSLWRGYHKTVTYFVNGRKALSIQDRELLYVIITWLNQGEIQEMVTCPNCGAICPVHVLMEECPYCKTHFIMSDLFPKITEYHFLRDYHVNEREANHKVSKWLLIGGAIGFLLVFPRTITDFIRAGEEGTSLSLRIISSFFSLLVPSAVAAFLGYAVGAFGMIGKLFKDAIRQGPMAIGIANAKKQLTNFMSVYDPTFSFVYFVATVQSLLKILIYTDDRSNLAVYQGPLDGITFDNIIDAQFGGAIRLNRCYVEGNYCYIDVNVHMVDVYCKNNRVYQKFDVFRMGLCRNITHPIDYGFSIKKVCCHGCGASFDASKERHCPFCGNAYDLKEDNWMITFITKGK